MKERSTFLFSYIIPNQPVVVSGLYKEMKAAIAPYGKGEAELKSKDLAKSGRAALTVVEVADMRTEMNRKLSIWEFLKEKKEAKSVRVKDSMIPFLERFFISER